MEPGLLTFHHIIHDSLMPWLDTFGDEKSIRKVVGNIECHLREEKSDFFVLLSKSLKQVGFEAKQGLKEDWTILSKTPRPVSALPLSSSYLQVIRGTAFFRFFSLLAVFAAERHLWWLRGETEEQNEVLGRYYVMGSLSKTAQLITDFKGVSLLDQEMLSIRSGINAVLAFIWLTIRQQFDFLIQQDGLTLFDEEVESQLILCEAGGEALKGLIQTLNQHLVKETETPASIKHTVTEPTVITENETNTDSEKDIHKLYQEIKTDLALVTDGISKISTVTHKSPMDEIRYLKPLETCQMLGISKATLNYWRKHGKINDFRAVGNRYEYNEAELKQLIKKRAIE
jgi:hypothetical protein